MCLVERQTLLNFNVNFETCYSADDTLPERLRDNEGLLCQHTINLLTYLQGGFFSDTMGKVFLQNYNCFLS